MFGLHSNQYIELFMQNHFYHRVNSKQILQNSSMNQLQCIFLICFRNQTQNLHSPANRNFSSDVIFSVKQLKSKCLQHNVSIDHWGLCMDYYIDRNNFKLINETTYRTSQKTRMPYHRKFWNFKTFWFLKKMERLHFLKHSVEKF